MTIRQKSADAVIVQVGKHGAFWFGFWVMLGALVAIEMVDSGHLVVSWLMFSALDWWRA